MGGGEFLYTMLNEDLITGQHVSQKLERESDPYKNGEKQSRQRSKCKAWKWKLGAFQPLYYSLN